MITDIPTPADFQSIGVQLLNSAWDTAASLLIDVDEADHYIDDTNELIDAFWNAARLQLSTALSIAQQGSEFLLKGRIASVSPFLLLAAVPREGPAGCAATDKPFSDFRTIDAQDLIKVHNACCSPRLPDSFVTEFEDLRKKRNSIMHSIDKSLSIHVSDLVVAVLSINEALGNEKNWVRIRRTYLNDAPQSQMHSSDWVDARLVPEFMSIRNLLKPAELKRFFAFDKNQPNYICPNCAYSVDPDSEYKSLTALLKPNTPESTELWCFVCEETNEVERKNCTEEDCKSNVLSHEQGRCLTCGADVS
jgi:hypothetical protein